MPIPTIREIRVVYYDEDTGAICQCRGNFWKTCPLRAAHDLPCTESVISITPVDRSESADLVDDQVRSIDEQFKDVADKLKSLVEKGLF